MFCKHLAVFTGILALGATLATPAMAHQLTAATATSMNCTGFCLQLAADQLTPGDQDKITYTITLTSTTGGATITVTGEVDFTADTSGTFTKTVCGNWLASGLPLNDNYVASGTAVLTTPSDTSSLSIDFGNQGTLTCSTAPPPTGKTFSMSNSMEGDLANIRPGDWISGGYSFKFTSSSHAATTYTVTTSITLPVYCPDGGGAGGDIFIPLGTQTYAIAAGDTSWHRTGDQNSILTWEGAVQAPDLCSGHRMRNQIGATFTATVSQNPQVGLVDWRFHYRDPAAIGKPNTNCTDATDPNRNRADVCGASWSQTFRDP